MKIPKIIKLLAVVPGAHSDPLLFR